MKMSESVKNIVPALLAAQKLMGGAKKGASNPYFKSKYADLGAVLEACKDLLNENGITILQPITGESVETVLVHTSGEWISSEVKIVVAKVNDPQAQGSAITYARRYGLQALLSMPAEDDDGESAMGRTSKKTTSTGYATTVAGTLVQGGTIASVATTVSKNETPVTLTTISPETKPAPDAAPNATVTNINSAPPKTGGFKPPSTKAKPAAPASGSDGW